MDNLTRLNCTVSELYPPSDVERLVNQHANERRKKRIQRARERQLHIAGAIAGLSLLLLLAAAVLAGLL